MSLLLTFPTNAELNEVVQEYVADTENFTGAQILPETDTYAQKIQWDERDRDRGATAPHVMGTDPKLDTRQGSKTHEFDPIPFKETDLLKEDEILKARELGTINNTLDLGREIARIAKNRLDKTRIRVEMMRWQALKGSLTINENGVKISETFPVQSHSPLVDWDNLSTATPLRDFNALKLKFRGTGASARGAKAYMNQVTVNWLLENQNEADLKGFQNSNFTNLAYSVDELNKIFSGRGLPEIIVNEDFWIDENDQEQLFLGDGEVVVVGQRMGGQKVGDVQRTPSLHLDKNGRPAPGYFSIIEVNGQPSDVVGSVSMGQLGKSKNPKVEITGGVYCGARLIYPRSVIKMIAAS
jgi:hypothetical protein